MIVENLDFSAKFEKYNAITTNNSRKMITFVA